MKTETPLIDLAPTLFNTVQKAQDALSKWIVPESGISDAEALNELLGILDNRELVKKMREVVPTGAVVNKFGTSKSEEIIHELYKTIEKLGGGSDILSAIGSFRDTLSDEEVLDDIKDYNNEKKE